MKKMEVTMKKTSLQKKMTVLVKHVEEWTLKKSINKDHNVYVRCFS